MTTRDFAAETAAALTDAWANFRDTAAQAMEEVGVVNPGAFARFDAYFAQVIDPSARMLGMKSIEGWVTDLADALDPDPALTDSMYGEAPTDEEVEAAAHR